MLKITTDQLEAANWNLTIDIHDAKLSGQVISLAESTCIRMIEDIAGIDRAAATATLKQLSRELKELRKQPKSKEQSRAIKLVYRQQSDIQYLPEYLCLVCKTKAAFKKACKGFIVNNMRYVRLVGTTGGVKQSTVVFVAETARNGAPLVDELRRRIDNGRDLTKEFVPAKLEAYRALVCSASTPLSVPRGVLVVDDCVTHFKSDYILLRDGDGDEPEMSMVLDGDVELVDSDGYGLMCPALAEQWGRDLRLDYRPAGVCVRNSFCKGMVFCFDFHEFADFVTGQYEVTDIWGRKHDIREVELVLTASMLKLWDSYPSWDVYWQNCTENGYCFAATKATPKELDVERRLNYQFTQSLSLTDDQVEKLCAPTLQELTDVMGGDYAKTLLFLRGKQLTEHTAWPIDTPWIAALSADKRMLNDPYVRNQLKGLVKKKITEAKFGKLKVHGNFSVISGDPYALCESIWGRPAKGILKAGELYNAYWAAAGADKVVAFRAPMSSAHNINVLSVNANWTASHWYQYMNTVTVLNAHDCTTHMLNGADKDGDLIFLTDNQVILDGRREVLPIVCEQNKARKCVPKEPDFIEANMLGFGDEIGSVTNKITAMTEIQSLFEPGSEEYETLAYRITAGQQLQQNVIDKMKGIIAKPMPKHWYDDDAAAKTGNPVDIKICASKKPYFMIYRYPELRSRYTSFQKMSLRKHKIKYGRSVHNDPECNFMDWYNRFCPVQFGVGVINRICAVCEEYFSKYSWKDHSARFDASVLKSGVDYSRYTRDQIKKLNEEYLEYLQTLSSTTAQDDIPLQRQALKQEYLQRCSVVVPDEVELCDILVDLTYDKEKSKQFAWDMCGEQMVKNVLKNSGNKVYWPRATPKGDLSFDGQPFKLEILNMSEATQDERDYFE